MDPIYLKSLELDKIARAAGMAVCSETKKKLLALQPLTDPMRCALH